MFGLDWWWWPQRQSEWLTSLVLETASGFLPMSQLGAFERTLFSSFKRWMMHLWVIISSIPLLLRYQLASPFSDASWATSSYRDAERYSTTAMRNLRQEVRDGILGSKALRAYLESESERTTDGAWTTPDKAKRKKVTERRREAANIIEGMMPRPTMMITRFVNYILRKIFRYLYVFGVHINEAEVAAVAARAAKGPIVLLPTHKSAFDFLLVLHLCFKHDLPLPFVLLEESLSVPILNHILRYAGVTFVRMNNGDVDPLYRIIYQEYVKQLLYHGHSLEFFVEGKRSLAGKVTTPKTGTLMSIVEAVRDGQVEDVYVVPVSISYDRIVESDANLDALEGTERRVTRRQLMRTALRYVSYLTTYFTRISSFGRVDISITTPFSVKEYMRNVLKVNVEEKDWLVDHAGVGTPSAVQLLALKLGYRILYDANNASTVLPSALVATVLLSNRTRGMDHEELLKMVYWIRDMIIARGGKIAEINANSVDLVLGMVFGSMKNKLVKRHKEHLMLSIYSPKERMELSIYRNQLIHLFVRDGLVTCAMYGLEKRTQAGASGHIEVAKDQLLQDTLFLSALLKYEFVYTPRHKSPGMHEGFELTLNELTTSHILNVSPAGKYYVNDELIDDENTGTDAFLFLCSLFWHYVDAYWLMALSFHLLLRQNTMQDVTLVKKAQELGETMFFTGVVDLYECIAQETLQNALRYFTETKVISCVTLMNGKTKTSIIQLQHDFQNPQRLEELVTRIGAFRKRSRKYRERRFMGTSDISDALTTVREMSREDARHV